MKKLILLILFSAIPALGQGVRYDSIAFAQGGKPLSGATITVCTSAGVGTPCTPLASIYTNQALTTTQSNPFTADSNGNYGFWAAPGTYFYSITGTGLTGFSGYITLAPPNAAIKPAASDAYFIVSGNGSDTTGDGLSGGSAYATWAKAKTACGSTPCVVTILETAASAGCPDTTATIVTFDYRYLATPCGNNTVSLNNPGNGSVTSASLQRVSLFISSPTTSAAGGIFFGDYTGALPANQSNEGLNATTTTSGTLTSVGSGYHLIGVEGSVSVQSNGQTLPDVRGLTGNCNLASGTTNVTKCSSVYAQAPTNTGTGTLTNAISFYAEMPTAGGTLNQAGHFDGQVTVGGTPGSPRIWIDKNADGQIEGSIFTLLSSGGGTITHQAPNTASNFTQTDAAVTGTPTVSDSCGIVDLTAQAASIGGTVICTPSANGFYRASCYVVETRAATTSSTLPQCQISYTDDSSTVQVVTLSGTATANLVGTMGTAGQFGQTSTFYAKASANIVYSAISYASSGATSMQYSIHVRVEGPF